jgi:hypothetical protein
MPARVLPLLLVAGALAADSAGRHELAFTFLVASVPAAAVSALALLGRLVELPGGYRGLGGMRLETFLSGVGLLFVVLAAAVRGQAADPGGLPALAGSAAVAATAVYAAQALAALLRPNGLPPVPERRELPAAPAATTLLD